MCVWSKPGFYELAIRLRINVDYLCVSDESHADEEWLLMWARLDYMKSVMQLMQSSGAMLRTCKEHMRRTKGFLPRSHAPWPLPREVPRRRSVLLVLLCFWSSAASSGAERRSRSLSREEPWGACGWPGKFDESDFFVHLSLVFQSDSELP